ncbi:hypothetical protein [Sphingomonas koreensis]|uniref:hypothetical protein n=1 Tax=Sphingomonas koreensis TaxID=93064 RepID=UPI000F7F3FF0|nr:hypothetical protein [Sphingomonas koreensis]
MKVRMTHAALICAAFAAFPSAAFAQSEYPELDAKCTELLKPGTSSDFTAMAINVQSSETTTTEDLGLISIVGIGPATSTYSGFTSPRVNGQSVNIHALANLTVTYAAGALATYQTKITTTTTLTGQCHVHKPTPGNVQDDDPLHPGYSIAPPGLQIDDPVTSTSTSVTYGTRTETIPGPWTDPNASQGGAQVVICISPGKVPGNWRPQNGYDGSLGTCSRAWYDTLGSTPSVSLPAT